jgi:hypothetical protein
MKLAFSLVWLWQLIRVLSWPYDHMKPRGSSWDLFDTRDCSYTKSRLRDVLETDEMSRSEGYMALKRAGWNLLHCLGDNPQALHPFQAVLLYCGPTVIPLVVCAWLRYGSNSLSLPVAASQGGVTAKEASPPCNIDSQLDTPLAPEKQFPNTGCVKKYDRDEDWDEVNVSKKRPALKKEEKQAET